MNPYTDQKNRAYSNILTSLFPEQTKTLPRIIVWGVVFLLDLIMVIGGAFSLGLMDPGVNYKLTGMLMIVAVIGIFWLQGKIWYGIVRYFQMRNKLD